MKQLSKIGKIASLIFFLGLIGFVVGLRHCNNNGAKASGIQPLHASVDIPCISFDIDASRDTIIYTGTGTSLTFLAGTLVKKNGVPVVGKVQVKIREFHDAVSILRSGIPMRLQSDRNAFLQSSGMLEIRAFQNGDELEIGSGKFINTELEYRFLLPILKPKVLDFSKTEAYLIHIVKQLIINEDGLKTAKYCPCHNLSFLPRDLTDKSINQQYKKDELNLI